MLYIQQCHKLRLLPAEMANLRLLEYLALFDCDGLESLPDLSRLPLLKKKNAVAISKDASPAARVWRDSGLKATEGERRGCARGCMC